MEAAWCQWLRLLSHRAVELLGLPSLHPGPLPHSMVAASSHWAAGYPSYMLGHLRWAAAESYCQAAQCSCAQPLSLAPASQPDVATAWPSPGSAGLAKDARGSCAARGLLVKTRAAKGLLDGVDGLDGTSRELRGLSGAGCLESRLNASVWGSTSGTAAPVVFTLSIIKLAVPPQALPHIMQCHSPSNAIGGMPATDLGRHVPDTPYMRAAADPSPVL